MKPETGPRYYPSARAIDKWELKRLRLELAGSQEMLAHRAGVSLSAVRKAEQGENIRIPLAKAIAGALSEAFDSLFVLPVVPSFAAPHNSSKRELVQIYKSNDGAPQSSVPQISFFPRQSSPGGIWFDLDSRTLWHM